MEEKYEPVSIRLTAGVHENLEKYWRVNMYKSKSSAIVQAIESLLESKICPNCKTSCPRASRICPVCFTPFDDESEYTITIQARKKEGDVYR